MGRFDGKSIIVTGSSSGIGQAAVIAFAKEGASVVVHGTNAQRIEKTVHLLKEASISEDRILVVQGEIQKEETLQNLISKTLEKFGKIDVLVNNAGISNASGCDPTSIENFDQVMAVNLRAPFRFIELSLPHLKKTKGNIINVSSVAAHMTPMNSPVMTVYCASKAALDRMTQVQALQFAPFGIRVNNINPGPFTTNISARNNLQMDPAHREIGEKIVTKVTPLGRSADPKELNEIFLLLADSDKGSFITGACWVIDGGMSVYATNPADLKF
jgi:NAD(P)-dependent dehydrogenase (short-subunit alcohol dehydrogenase family)